MLQSFMKLKVKIGNETRQLVAGIADQYTPEEMPGKRIIVLVNLKPAKIKGIESQGMLLAAVGEGDKLALLTVDRDIEDGVEVC